MKTPSKHYLRLECFLLMVVLPTAILLSGLARYLLYPVLWVMAVLCLWRLLKDPEFDRSRLWNARAVNRYSLREIALLFVPLALMLVVFTWLYVPERFFVFPRDRTQLWALVMLLYPLLSVYPQEVIYRTFFFHRYRSILGGSWKIVVASAVAFGYAHIMMANWIAVVFSAIGGLLFGYRYLLHRSTLLASIEHALYGNFVFTAGLGWYFYHAAMR